MDECLDEFRQPFFPDHAGEVADDGWSGWLGWVVAFEVDPVGHDFDMKFGRIESLAHEVGIKLTGSHKEVGIDEAAAEFGPAIGLEGFGEAVEEAVLALEIADDFHAESLLELANHAGLEGGAEAEDVRLVGGEPVDEFVEFLAEVAVLDAEHGQCHRAMCVGGSHVAAFGGGAEEAGVIEDVVQPAGSVAEEGHFLLEIDIDAAKEDRDLRLRQHFLIELKRKIHRQQGNLVAGGKERFREGIVAHTGSAIVGAGAGSEEGEVHFGDSRLGDTRRKTGTIGKGASIREKPVRLKKRITTGANSIRPLRERVRSRAARAVPRNRRWLGRGRCSLYLRRCR